jgi:ribosomal protein S18 acetylase RimI-like enzyme
MVEVTVREARPGDGAACARLWREIGTLFAAMNPETFQEPATEGLDEWFEEINTVIRDDAAKLHLVAEVDGEIVGHVSASLHEPIGTAARQLQIDFSRRRLHIDGLSVAKEHRQSGIGSALMQAAEDWGSARGAEVVLLETESNNSMSVPFYEQRMGFTANTIGYRKEMPPAERQRER